MILSQDVLLNRSRTFLHSLESLQQSRNEAALEQANNNNNPHVGSMEVLWSSIDSGTLQDVCSDMMDFDIDIHHIQMKKILLGFSITIRGVPECSNEDLPLAVYLLLEDVLGIQTSIEFCVRFTEGWDPTLIVGVMFDDRNVRNRVLKKSHRFRGTDILVSPNLNFQWILDHY